jgi:hypothetical protein
MEITFYSETIAKNWDDFVMRNDDAWFWHTTDWMLYCLNSQFGVTTVNKSFCLRENKKIVAIVPLVVENKVVDGKEMVEMFYGGWPTPVPVIEISKNQNKKDRIYKYVFDRIDNIANENNAQRSVFRIYDAYSSYKKGNIVYNFTMRHGFIDVSLNTQVIDISLKKENLLQSFSESSIRNINKAEDLLAVEFYDSENISRGKYDMFKTFYFRIAGKITRPNECLEVLYRLILKGVVFLAFALYNNSLVGVQMVIHYKSGAYYLLSAVEKEFNYCSIGHFMQWNVMKYLRDKDIDYYEIGIQQYGNTLYDFPDEKDIGISEFKRRFGGVTVPLFTGEKYYVKKFFKKIWQKRIDSYIEQYDN